MVLYKNRALGKDTYYCSNKSAKLPKMVDGNEDTYEVTSDGGLLMGIDLGQLYFISHIRIKANTGYAYTTIPVFGGVECSNSPSDKLAEFMFWSSPAWLEASVSKTVRYITLQQAYRHVIYEVQINEILTTTTLSASLDKSVVAPNPPNNKFTVTGNVKDQYNDPMNGQFVSIKIYKDTTVVADASTTADANGNFSSTIPTTNWSPGTYEVRVVSDSLTQSFNLTVKFMSTVVFNSVCKDTGLPCPADVYLDNILRGTTPLTLNDVPIGEHNYRISKTGYVNATGIVTVQQGITSTVNVNLNPAIGNIYFSSEPQGATIILDGITQPSLTPATLTGMPTGTHNYVLRKANFIDNLGKVDVVLGQTSNVSAALVPVDGCVYFTSIPPGARIIVDDVDTGKVTPYMVCGLTLGLHTYKLTIVGYQSVTGTVDLTSGHGVAVSSTLPVAKGVISFSSIPSGAEVFLDGADQGVITPVTITDVSVGPHSFTLKLTGFNDYSRTVEVIESQTSQISVSLVPVEGCVYFTSIPPGARIFIDDVERSGIKTPALVCSLNIGSHVYKLTLAGYDDVIDTIVLGAGSGLIIKKTLRQSPILTDITISPMSPSVVVGNTQSFNATPIDQYGNPFSATVTWNNSNSFVGNIDPSTGLFTALHTGTTIVTATSGTMSRSTTVTVTPLIPVLATITISPATVSVAIGNATIFTATTLDQLGNPFQTTVTWSSSNINIGTITQNGVFTAISPGTTTIMAKSGNVSRVAVANVTPVIPTAQPVLTKITVTPLTETLIVGTGTVFVASTLDQFGNPFPATVTWSSNNVNVGTIDQYGVFSALHIGRTTIIATSGNVVGVALASVVKTLPGQAAGGIFGSINQAALILGAAMIGTVLMAKPAQPSEIRIIERMH